MNKNVFHFFHIYREDDSLVDQIDYDIPTAVCDYTHDLCLISIVFYLLSSFYFAYWYARGFAFAEIVIPNRLSRFVCCRRVCIEFFESVWKVSYELCEI